MPRFALVFNGLLFVGIGLGFVFAPGQLMETVGLDVRGSLGLTDLRATYGGANLGAGSFMLYCCLETKLWRPGLLVATAILGGYFLARCLGMILDQPEGVFHLMVALSEIVCLTVCALGLRAESADSSGQ